MARDGDVPSENEDNSENVKTWFVPACGYKNFCCCPKGKEDTVCLHTHECPFRPKQPIRKCFPICTTDEVKPIYTPCLKKIIEEIDNEEDVDEEEKVRGVSTEDLDDEDDGRRHKVQIAGFVEPIEQSETSFEKLYKKRVRRVCMADEEPPKVVCSCGSPTCQRCRNTTFTFKKVEDDMGEEEEKAYDPLCEDILECDCGLHNCIRCRTKKQLQEQLKKRICRCNLPECIECKWYSICEVCAAPAPSRSKYYYRRKQLMENEGEFPTISEVKKECQDLSKLVFDQCIDSLKDKLGLTPPLGGPGEVLWQSPSDLLEGKVILKPPYSNRCIKALTHEGILKIGSVIEQKFLNEMELEKQRALKEQRETLEYLFEIEKQEAINATRAEERALCEERMLELNARWEEELQEELQLLEARLTAEFELLLQQQRDELEIIWQAKLDEAVRETTEKLTALFMEDLKRQEEELTKKFNEELKKMEIKYKIKEKADIEKYEEKLRQLRHQLECKNIANLMCVLCVERKKCMAEKEALMKECEKQYKDQYNQEMEDKITELNETIKEKQRQLDLREEYLREIIQQYQKFINFALKSSPTQAEFLLSLEKMLLFELTKQVVKQSPKLIEEFQPWKEDSEIISARGSKRNLVETDYHGCFKELEPPGDDREVDDLPHFYYNKNLYVREDFRNLLSTGREVDSSYELWSKNVQDLINIMKGPLKKPIRVDDDELPELKGVKSQNMTKSNVYFAGAQVLDESRSVDTEFKMMTKNKASLKPSSKLQLGPINYLALHKESERDTLLIGAVNSLELLKKKLSAKQPLGSDTYETKEDTETETITSEQEQTQETDVPVETLILQRLSEEDNVSTIPFIPLKPESQARTDKQPSEKVKKRVSVSQKSVSNENVKPIETSVSVITDSLIIHRMSFSKKAYEHGKPTMMISSPKQTPMIRDDSITMLKEEEELYEASKLNVAKDSLEIARKQSSEVVDGIVSKALKSPKCHLSQEQIIKVDLDTADEDTKKAVKMSHIEVIKLPEKKPSAVSFTTEPHIIETSSIQSSDSPLLIYGEERDDFLNKPNEVKVVGDKNAKEHLQRTSEFTFTRASSLLKMFDGRPDLIRMFTAGSK
ncbi:uncharacterized protein LOC112904709 [Agrilus planipennis]|uniref:Uncharacterized protein LOC108742393 n=1 Tax=Agrilus planipennis TaxID=224129 RepID=A0A1W4XJY6_AGRPL|nr:uncharacterized protein LOC108742393 [Agrilus planipennis]XP_025831251.1 uncharacterized protein LOC112904709 [Agrilus planipennis]